VEYQRERWEIQHQSNQLASIESLNNLNEIDGKRQLNQWIASMKSIDSVNKING